jgi:hypothetical protein
VAKVGTQAVTEVGTEGIKVYAVTPTALWQSLIGPWQHSELIVLAIGALVTLLQKNVAKSFFATLALAVILGITDGAAVLGHPLQGIAVACVLGMVVGLVLRIGFGLIGIISRIFGSVLPIELPWMFVCAVWFFLAVRAELHAPPGKVTPSLGEWLESGYQKVISFL